MGARQEWFFQSPDFWKLLDAIEGLGKIRNLEKIEKKCLSRGIRADREMIREALEFLTELNSSPGLDSDKDPLSGQKKMDFIKRISTRAPSVNKALEKSIRERLSIFLGFKNGTICEFHPHQLLILDERIAVIGEDVNNRRLNSFYLDDIDHCHVGDNKGYKPNFSQIEVKTSFTP